MSSIIQALCKFPNSFRSFIIAREKWNRLFEVVSWAVFSTLITAANDFSELFGFLCSKTGERTHHIYFWILSKLHIPQLILGVRFSCHACQQWRASNLVLWLMPLIGYSPSRKRSASTLKLGKWELFLVKLCPEWRVHLWLLVVCAQHYQKPH